MLERGEISFIFLWILNPMVILFYQNCSWTPVNHAEASMANFASTEPNSNLKWTECKYPEGVRICIE